MYLWVPSRRWWGVPPGVPPGVGWGGSPRGAPRWPDQDRGGGVHPSPPQDTPLRSGGGAQTPTPYHHMVGGSPLPPYPPSPSWARRSALAPSVAGSLSPPSAHPPYHTWTTAPSRGTHTAKRSTKVFVLSTPRPPRGATRVPRCEHRSHSSEESSVCAGLRRASWFFLGPMSFCACATALRCVA